MFGCPPHKLVSTSTSLIFHESSATCQKPKEPQLTIITEVFSVESQNPQFKKLPTEERGAAEN